MSETAPSSECPNLLDFPHEILVSIVSYIENPKPFLSAASTPHNAGKTDSLRLQWVWQQRLWQSQRDYSARIISANVLEALIRRAEFYIKLQYEAQRRQGEPRMIRLHTFYGDLDGLLLNDAISISSEFISPFRLYWTEYKMLVCKFHDTIFSVNTRDS